MTDAYAPTPRTRPVRRAQRANYDKTLIHSILDETLIGALSTIIEGEPHVQPMIHARAGEALIFHGSGANRMLGALAAGARACFNVSLIDGLVLGRSVPDHTFQYRSVTVHGVARAHEDADEKRRLMRIVFDHIIANRWAHLPPVSAAYLDTMMVLTLPLKECVAKVNRATPADEPGEPAHAVWSGLVPFRFAADAPRAAPGPQPETPAEIAHYARTRR